MSVSYFYNLKQVTLLIIRVKSIFDLILSVFYFLFLFSSKLRQTYFTSRLTGLRKNDSGPAINWHGRQKTDPKEKPQIFRKFYQKFQVIISCEFYVNKYVRVTTKVKEYSIFITCLK